MPARGRSRFCSNRWMTRGCGRRYSPKQALMQLKRLPSGGFVACCIIWCRTRPFIPLARFYVDSIPIPHSRRLFAAITGAHSGTAPCLEFGSESRAAFWADKDPEGREFTLIGLKGGLDRQRRRGVPLDLLRAAVARLVAVPIDGWEAAYNRYYRLPGRAHAVSSDMESEQQRYQIQRSALSPLLARAGQLCREHGLANPFPGLLRSSLGQYAPQHRVESAISRNERNAIATCLDQLTGACRGCPPAAKREPGAPEPLPFEAPRAGSRAWFGIILVAVVFCAHQR